MVLYSKFTYGSQFLGEKNALEIRFPVAEKLSKYKRSIFFETPCNNFLFVMKNEYMLQHFSN